MIFVAACLGGLFLILRDLFPWLEAKRSGVLKTRGYSPKRVLRSEDPERFKGYLRNRVDGMVIGLLAIGFGIGWVLFGLFALILIVPIGAIMTAMNRRGKKKARVVADEFA
ncbi:MAG: ABC transporter ATP-binding protein [Brevundimonas sp.]|nr:MAG: ABC transporter ATP-binding protein [Brevundimonas sp.]